MGMPILSKALRDLLFGNPFGEVYPPKPNPPPLAWDGRTAALRILKRYISELTFYRAGAVDAQGNRGPAIPFQIGLDKIFIEWPDNVTDQGFPSIVMLSGGAANFNAIGMTSYVEEDTRDVFGPGTVVQWQSEYQEDIVLEIQATKRAERRGILAALIPALVPTEQMYGIRFRMPEYYNELVCFTIMKQELPDDENSAINRRKAKLTVQMRFNAVALVNYTILNTVLKTEVDVDEDTNLAVTIDDEGPSDTRPITLPRGPCGPSDPFE